MRLAIPSMSRAPRYLRHIHQTDTATQRTNETSSVTFAIQSFQGTVTTSIVGNMGVPLRTGEARDSGEDAEEVHFSDDPFDFGLELADGSAEMGNIDVETHSTCPEGQIQPH